MAGSNYAGFLITTEIPGTAKGTVPDTFLFTSKFGTACEALPPVTVTGPGAGAETPVAENWTGDAIAGPETPADCETGLVLR